MLFNIDIFSLDSKQNSITTCFHCRFKEMMLSMGKKEKRVKDSEPKVKGLKNLPTSKKHFEKKNDVPVKNEKTGKKKVSSSKSEKNLKKSELPFKSEENGKTNELPIESEEIDKDVESTVEIEEKGKKNKSPGKNEKMLVSKRLAKKGKKRNVKEENTKEVEQEISSQESQEPSILDFTWEPDVDDDNGDDFDPVELPVDKKDKDFEMKKKTKGKKTPGRRVGTRIKENQKSSVDNDAELFDTSKDNDVEPVCLQCGNQFKNIMGLNNHLNRLGHEQICEEETDYKCYTCFRYFQRKCDLDRHMDATDHNGNSTGMNDVRTVEPVKRMRENCKKSAALFKCSLCKAGYKYEKNCQQHVNAGTCSRKFRKYCPCCGVSFTVRNYMQLHLRQKHRDEYPFKCKQCTDIFYNFRAYTMHQQVHRRKAEDSQELNQAKEGALESSSKIDNSVSIESSPKLDNSVSQAEADDSVEQNGDINFCEKDIDAMTTEQRKKYLSKLQRKIRGVSDQDAIISDVLDCKQECVICQQAFANYAQLRIHILEMNHEQIVAEETGYKCYTCNQYFVKFADLEIHMTLTSHSGNPDGEVERQALRAESRFVNTAYKCSYCESRFPTLEKCEEHTKKARCEKKYKRQCPCCEMSFLKQNLFQAHMHQKHKYEYPFICDKCEEVQTSLTVYISHRKTHRDIKKMKNENAVVIPVVEAKLPTFDCDVCMKKFEKKFQLMKHVQSVHSVQTKEPINLDALEEVTNFKCFTCDMYFENMASLEEHMYQTSHTGNPENTEEVKILSVQVKNFLGTGKVHPYSCSKCKVRFPVFKTAQRHIDAGKCKPYFKRKCPCCGTKFAKKNLFEAHLLEYHKDEYPFKCEDCPRVFYQAPAYSTHRVNAHNREPFSPYPEGMIKVYQCEICHKSLKGRGNYNSHMRGVHTEYKSFVCDYCGKKFSRQQYLKDHVR